VLQKVLIFFLSFLIFYFEDEFKPRLKKLLKEICLIAEVAELAEKIDELMNEGAPSFLSSKRSDCDVNAQEFMRSRSRESMMIDSKEIRYAIPLGQYNGEQKNIQWRTMFLAWTAIANTRTIVMKRQQVRSRR